jgi:hypothetical protein
MFLYACEGSSFRPFQIFSSSIWPTGNMVGASNLEGSKARPSPILLSHMQTWPTKLINNYYVADSCSKLPTCLTWTPVLKVMHPALRKSWALQALSLAHLLAISQVSNTNHSPLSLQNIPMAKKMGEKSIQVVKETLQTSDSS